MLLFAKVVLHPLSMDRLGSAECFVCFVLFACFVCLFVCFFWGGYYPFET